MNKTLPSKERIAFEIESYFSTNNRSGSRVVDPSSYSSFHTLRKFLEAKFVISLEPLEDDIKRAIFLSQTFNDHYLSSLPSQSHKISPADDLVAFHGSVTHQSLVIPLLSPYFILEFHHHLIIKSIKMDIFPTVAMDISIKDCDHEGQDISLTLKPSQQGTTTNDFRREVRLNFIPRHLLLTDLQWSLYPVSFSKRLMVTFQTSNHLKMFEDFYIVRNIEIEEVIAY
jgi:hypothetical protein